MTAFCRTPTAHLTGLDDSWFDSLQVTASACFQLTKAHSRRQ